jgi:hypothetical protein
MFSLAGVFLSNEVQSYDTFRYIIVIYIMKPVKKKK